MRTILLAGLCQSMLLLAQQTCVVTVNPNGTFSPPSLKIRSGDIVRWDQLKRTDSIIPVADAKASYPEICSSRRPFDVSDPNEFTGPLPFAPSGVDSLSPFAEGFSEADASCPRGTKPIATSIFWQNPLLRRR